MPIYDYQCSQCGHGFELRHGFDAEVEQECPLCQATSRRRFHPVGVIYKGSGFYTTDYKNKSSNFPTQTNNGKEDQNSKKDTETTKSESSKTDNQKSDISKTESQKGDTSKEISSTP